MERNLYNDEEFEDLIQEKAGQYKMYPSDKVWKNINASLHTRRRWFFAGMATLITGILFFAGKELLSPPSHIVSAKKTITDKNNNKDNESSTKQKDNYVINNPSPQKRAAETPIAPAFAEFNPISSPDKNRDGEPEINISGDSAFTNVVSAYTERLSTTISTDQTNDDISANDPSEFHSRHIDVIGTDKKPLNDSKENIRNSIDAKPENTSSVSGIMIDKKQSKILENVASFELVSPKKLNRKYWQIYLAPTVNYRTLSGAELDANTKPNIQNGPIAAVAAYGNPNLYTNNKPAMGFEAGSSFLYRFTRNLSFKVGLQFNYISYSINAYALNSQPATIALNSIGYIPSTITSYTNIGTVGGKGSVNLQNQYMQFSAPIGFELRILGNEKLQFSIGATVQPTYLLNRDSYLLTADYTNYIQEPSLFKRWNVNGAVEAFLSYNTGKVRWQIGPQFRYQLLSTYVSQYPITENLKEFGIKFGIVKTIW